MFDDWEDALGEDVKIEKKGNEAFEGEDFKVDKPKEPEVKQMTAEEKEKHDKAKEAQKKAKAKKYMQEEPARELTENEKKRMEEEAKKNDMRLCADLFGDDAKTGEKIIDLKLENEGDYIAFGKLIANKIEKAKSKKWIVEFFGKMFKELEPTITSKEYDGIKTKVTPLLNAALQKEKGKDGKKKKSKGTSLQTGHAKSQRENTDLYNGYAMDDDFGGGNVDAGRYEEDDDFM